MAVIAPRKIDPFANVQADCLPPFRVRYRRWTRVMVRIVRCIVSACLECAESSKGRQSAAESLRLVVFVRLVAIDRFAEPISYAFVSAQCLQMWVPQSHRHMLLHQSLEKRLSHLTSMLRPSPLPNRLTPCKPQTRSLLHNLFSTRMPTSTKAIHKPVRCRCRCQFVPLLRWPPVFTFLPLLYSQRPPRHSSRRFRPRPRKVRLPPPLQTISALHCMWATSQTRLRRPISSSCSRNLGKVSVGLQRDYVRAVMDCDQLCGADRYCLSLICRLY